MVVDGEDGKKVGQVQVRDTEMYAEGVHSLFEEDFVTKNDCGN